MTLNDYVRGAHVLDMFAGDGSLLLQHYSRHCCTVDCVEIDPAKAAHLADLPAVFNVWAADARTRPWEERRYDVAVLDIPWALRDDAWPIIEARACADVILYNVFDEAEYARRCGWTGGDFRPSPRRSFFAIDRAPGVWWEVFR